MFDRALGAFPTSDMVDKCNKKTNKLGYYFLKLQRDISMEC